MTISARYTLMFGLYHIAIGISLPYLPTWYAQVRHLDPAWVGIMLSSPLIARLATGSVLTAIADKLASLRLAITGFFTLATACYAAMLIAPSPWILLIVSFCGYTFLVASGPLLEGALVRAGKLGRPSYGVARAIASSCFVIGSLLGGNLLAHHGAETVFVAILVTMGLASLYAITIPAQPVAADGELPQTPSQRPSFRRALAASGELFREKGLMRVLIAGGLIQAAHAFYYGFSTLSWLEQGISGDVIGYLWAFAVVIEIIFLTSSRHILRQMHPEILILIGGVGAVIRWTCMSFAPDLVWLWPLQALHAATFAAAHVGVVVYIDRHETGDRFFAANTLNAGLAAGTLIGLATMLSGHLYKLAGAQGYGAMAVLGLLGIIVAWPVIRSSWRAPIVLGPHEAPMLRTPPSPPAPAPRD